MKLTLHMGMDRRNEASTRLQAGVSHRRQVILAAPEWAIVDRLRLPARPDGHGPVGHLGLHGRVEGWLSTTASKRVTIFGIQHDRILWGWLYLDGIDRSGGSIDQAVRRTTTTAE
jgi:hypothetical protein